MEVDAEVEASASSTAADDSEHADKGKRKDESSVQGATERRAQGTEGATAGKGKAKMDQDSAGEEPEELKVDSWIYAIGTNNNSKSKAKSNSKGLIRVRATLGYSSALFSAQLGDYWTSKLRTGEGGRLKAMFGVGIGSIHVIAQEVLPEQLRSQPPPRSADQDATATLATAAPPAPPAPPAGAAGAATVATAVGAAGAAAPSVANAGTAAPSVANASTAALSTDGGAGDSGGADDSSGGGDDFGAGANASSDDADADDGDDGNPFFFFRSLSEAACALGVNNKLVSKFSYSSTSVSSLSSPSAFLPARDRLWRIWRVSSNPANATSAASISDGDEGSSSGEDRAVTRGLGASVAQATACSNESTFEAVMEDVEDEPGSENWVRTRVRALIAGGMLQRQVAASAGVNQGGLSQWLHRKLAAGASRNMAMRMRAWLRRPQPKEEEGEGAAIGDEEPQEEGGGEEWEEDDAEDEDWHEDSFKWKEKEAEKKAKEEPMVDFNDPEVMRKMVEDAKKNGGGGGFQGFGGMGSMGGMGGFGAPGGMQVIIFTLSAVC